MTKNEVIIGADHQRGLIGALDKDVLELKTSIALVPGIGHLERGEALANIMLAHRHLEDARMRIGKMIQALEGGVSIFEHPKVKALIAEIRAGG